MTKVDTIKTKEARGKRNLNIFGNSDNNRRRDVYNYQTAGYSEYLITAFNEYIEECLLD